MILVASTCLAACGTLVDADYAGEALIELQAVAALGVSTDSTSSAKGGALWQGLETGAFVRLPLRVEFPTMWLGVLSLPQRDVMFQLAPDEAAIGEAYLHIVKPDTGEAPRGSDFIATDYMHVLVYVSAELAPGGLTAMYLGAALAPGFHVTKRSSTSELTAPQQVLVERCIARAAAGPPDRVRDLCTALHLYRLEPTPGDLETILRFEVESTST